MTDDHQAVVLVVRPTPAGLDQRAVRRLADEVAARTPSPVGIAHLDHAEPSLHDVLDDIAACRTRSALVLALAVPADRYPVTWIATAVADSLAAGSVPAGSEQGVEQITRDRRRR